jgi:hypothetical protein
MSAATPATWGEAIEVPEIVIAVFVGFLLFFAFIQALVISLPCM